MKKILTLVLITGQILLFLPFRAIAQQATEIKQNPSEKKTEDEAKKKFKENSVEFVRSIGRDATTLNLAENRIGFSMQAADLLWEADEKTAREIFQTAMTDLRVLIIENDKLRLAETAAEDEEYTPQNMSGQLGASRKSAAVMRLREQFVMTLAKYDAKTAYNFLLETRPADVAKKQNGMFYYQAPNNEARLEAQLAEIVARQDSSMALEIALKSLEKGFADNYKIQSLLANLYKKDSEKGAKLAGEIVKKLHSVKIAEEYNAQNIAFEILASSSASLEQKNKPPSGATAPKVPLLDESATRDLAEMLVKAGLDTPFNESNRYGIFANLERNLPLLQKYAPSSTAQLKAKLAQGKAKSSSSGNTATSNRVVSDSGSANIVVAAETPDPKAIEKARRAEETAKAEKEEFERLGTSASTPDSKVSADEFRASLGKIKNRNAKLLSYTQIAYQLAKTGNLKTAKELLADAQALTVPQARKSSEMLEHLMLIRAYSVADPDRAFQMMEPIIYELNEVVEGFAKVASFIIEELVIENGEFDLTGLQSEFFGRGGISGQLFAGLDESLQNMAKADFNRTTALADKFTRPEVRLTAKMIIARSLMPQKENNAEEVSISADNSDEVGVPPPPPKPIAVPPQKR